MAVDSNIEKLGSKPVKATRFSHVRLSSVEDFSPGWVQTVIRSFYMDHGLAPPPAIKNYTVEQLGDGLEFSRSESFDSNANTEANEDSPPVDVGNIHSTLSQSFRLVVEMDLEPPVGSTGSVGGAASFRGERSPPAIMAARMHNLFVKVPLAKKAKFERIVKRNRTLSHEVQVYSGFLQDLQKFVKSRVGDAIKLNIPELYYGSVDTAEGDVLIIEDLSKQGFASRDWFKHKLTHEEVKSAVYELAKFHACGLAYRMSLNEEIEDKYTYLDDDLYTSNMAKELLAKYLDSYFHFLSVLPGIKEHVHKLRKISSDVFSLLVKLRRPSDPLGKRFNTVCHGDMWMGNLMYKGGEECMLVDFHSCQYLSPATDLAHLLLTSTDRKYRKKHWDEVIQYYYDTFNRTLAEFGLILRHLGTTYNDFLYEVKRALRGQFLCVAFIIPIVIYCGPGEWRIERRRGSSVDRKNTIRHLIQMMAISEDSAMFHSHPGSPVEETSIPSEFVDLYNDEPLRNTLIDLIKTAADLDILDFHEFCKHIDTPRPMWTKTQATTGKHIPVY